MPQIDFTDAEAEFLRNIFSQMSIRPDGPNPAEALSLLVSITGKLKPVAVKLVAEAPAVEPAVESQS